jgi:hypothetical protein
MASCVLLHFFVRATRITLVGNTLVMFHGTGNAKNDYHINIDQLLTPFFHLIQKNVKRQTRQKMTQMMEQVSLLHCSNC